MRIRSAFFMSLLLAGAAPAASVSAFAAMSEQDAVSRVHLAGYQLVSKAEAQASGIWDVWASKDGVPYEVKVDATDGSVIQATPRGGND